MSEGELKRKWKWWQLHTRESESGNKWVQEKVKFLFFGTNYQKSSLARTKSITTWWGHWILSHCIRSEFDRWKTSTATCDNYKRKHTKSSSKQGSFSKIPVTKHWNKLGQKYKKLVFWLQVQCWPLAASCFPASASSWPRSGSLQSLQTQVSFHFHFHHGCPLAVNSNCLFRFCKIEVQSESVWGHDWPLFANRSLSCGIE